jgi:hypothetical protein
MEDLTLMVRKSKFCLDNYLTGQVKTDDFSERQTIVSAFESPAEDK